MEHQTDHLENCKQLIKENLESFQHLSLQDIDLKKLTGLTNETYRAKNINQEKQKSPNVVLFRIFGSAEGLINKDKEHEIFIQLGQKGLGPKVYASEKGVWRIEEFITEGVHPSHEILGQEKYRYLMALYMAQFHQSDLQIPEEAPLIDSLLKNQQLFEEFEKKANTENLFSESEQQIILNIKQLIKPEMLQELQSIKPQTLPFICHNDLNNLNIFYSQGKLKNQIKLIDYEYASYNYASYDIANYMNESCMNYDVASTPFFKYESDNFFAPKDIEKFSFVYLYSLQFQSEFDEIENLIDTEYSTVVQKLGQKLAQKEESVQNKFYQDHKQLIKEVNAARIISNWYWVLWSVITSKPEIEMDFDHLAYGEKRLGLFQELKEKFYEEFK